MFYIERAEVAGGQSLVSWVILFRAVAVSNDLQTKQTGTFA
jgi:hypothetical protein